MAISRNGSVYVVASVVYALCHACGRIQFSIHKTKKKWETKTQSRHKNATVKFDADATVANSQIIKTDEVHNDDFIH